MSLGLLGAFTTDWPYCVAFVPKPPVYGRSLRPVLRTQARFDGTLTLAQQGAGRRYNALLGAVIDPPKADELPRVIYLVASKRELHAGRNVAAVGVRVAQ